LRLHRAQKRLENALEKIRNCAIIVEGKKDAAALEACGIDNVYVFGQIGRTCERIKERGHEKVAILTDMDRAGEKKLLFATDAAIAAGLSVEVGARKALSGLLILRNFEDMQRKLESFGKNREKRDSKRDG
jgi:uroporphyrinogen-III synthase